MAWTFWTKEGPYPAGIRKLDFSARNIVTKLTELSRLPSGLHAIFNEAMREKLWEKT
jgi:hypothetical protein